MQVLHYDDHIMKHHVVQVLYIFNQFYVIYFFIVTLHVQFVIVSLQRTADALIFLVVGRKRSVSTCKPSRLLV